MPPGDGQPEAVTVTYSIDEPDQPLVAIIEAVAEFLDATPEQLGPLQDTLDVEALAQLLGQPRADFYRGPDSPSGIEPTVTFVYEGCVVLVTPKWIQVGPAR